VPIAVTTVFYIAFSSLCRRFEIGLGSELPSVEELSDHIQFLRSDHAR
jgi:hypothetical protein